MVNRRLFQGIRKRIALKLSVTMAAIVILVQLCFSWYEVVEDKTQMEADLTAKEMALDKIVANAFQNAIWNYNFTGAATIADSILKDSDTAGIKIVDAQGTMIYAHDKKGVEYGTAYRIGKRIPVQYNGLVIGVVDLDFTNYFLKERIRSSTRLKILETVIMTVLLIGALLLASFRITKPIKLLSSGTDEIAAGNLLKPIPILSSDEIGELAGKFNHMADRLHQIKQERERAMEALSVSEEKFSKAFQSSADLVGIVRLRDQHFVDVSDSFFDCMGYSVEEVIEHTSDSFGLWAFPEDRTAFYEKIQADDFNTRLDTVWRTRSGEVRSGLLAVNRIFVSREPCLIFVWHDITERKQAEEALMKVHDHLEAKVDERTQELVALNSDLRKTNVQLFNTLEVLKKTQDQLIKSEKMAGLATLVAGVAHEVNTPIGIAMTAITHMNDLHDRFEAAYREGNMKRQVLEDYLKHSDETIHMIINNLYRAAKLIHSFKQVSVDQSSEAIRSFDVLKYLDELLLSLHPKLKKSNQTVVVDCPSNLEIESYPGAFAQIITNLIMNSLLHAYEPEDAGTITISVTKDDRMLHIRYSDDGIGMEDAVRKRIFDPFFTTKRQEGGTGLGLHVIYNIITLQLGGTIECQSEPQKGTSFMIALPVKITKEGGEA